MLPAGFQRAWPALIVLLVAGCAPGPAPTPSPERGASGSGLPPVPVVHGPLKLSIVYPDSLARIAVQDSSFVFGSVGDGSAQLRINGDSVDVAPNGAWLAWIPFRGDSVVTLHLEARTARDSARLEYHIRRVPRFVPPAAPALWIDTTSLSPVGRAWWPADRYLPLSLRASAGATLLLQLPGAAPLALTAASGGERYRGLLRGVRFGDPGPLLGPAGGTRGGEPLLLAIKGTDTLRVPWPLRLALLDSLPINVELDDDPQHQGGTDSISVGRAAPAATYTWFFPTGTRARVSGRLNGDLRLALSSRSEAWVAAAEALPVTSTVTGPQVVESVTLSPRGDRVVARIPVGARVPFAIFEEERALSVLLYGAVSDINWLHYGREDSLVSLATTRQVSADELELRFALAAPVWGYRVHWQGTTLLLEIRRPPPIDPKAPLSGRTIVVDPGHPPAGATGPTGLRESEANLAIGLRLADLLRAEGARVLLTRSDARSLELWPRIRFADSADADVLLSIHNNALPDGINPFSNNGSSAFYNHPRALPLARAIQARMVAHFGLRDLGAARGDLALVRPTWMPAVLTEGLFLMLPEQEAALRNPVGQQRYAAAVLEGLQAFLARRASGAW
jgi:N-acetylmuramoyl-L-alanine amidase